MKIKFNKIDPKAVIPTKRNEDLGYDLYKIDENMVIPAHTIAKFHTGLRSSFSKRWGVIFKDRSSLGSKGIRVGAGVIDSGYRGEWIIALINETDHDFELPEGKAIAQFYVVRNYRSKIQEINNTEFEKLNSERGIGGFGSTGK